MNKMIFLFYILLLSNTYLESKIGCMDNSKHLAEQFDTKNYYYVSCNCPCLRTIADRNQCIECKHFHDGQRFMLVPTYSQTKVKQAMHTTIDIGNQNMQTIMSELFKEYKKRKLGFLQ